MRIAALAVSFVLLQPVFPQAGPTIDQTLDSLVAVHEFREASVSPGGAMAAWVETVRAKDKGESRNSSIFVKDLRDTSSLPRHVSDSTAYDNHLAWSKDGKLAFLSDAGSPGQTQLFVADKPGHASPKKITNLKGYL